MIRTENLSKTYGKGDGSVAALQGIDITINDGELVAIIGKSGSGKSTLLNLLGGLNLPNDGKIFYDDTEITSLGDSALADFRLKNIGFVFQFFDLIPELTAEENILLPARLAKNSSANADGLYNALGISDRIKHYPSELSGGQQQRAAIARALVNDPKILLCDEPTGNLDESSGKDVMKLLKELNEHGRTVVIVTHDSDIASQCEKVIEISDGQIVR